MDYVMPDCVDVGLAEASQFEVEVYRQLLGLVVGY